MIKKFSYKTYLYCCLLLMYCVSNASVAYGTTSVLDRLVASVNGQAITESDLNFRTQLLMLHLKADSETPAIEMLQKQLLDKMILEKLQLELATPEELKIDPIEVDQHIIKLANQDKISVETFKAFLNEQQIHFEKFKQWIQNEMILAKVQQREISQSIHVTDSEINQFLHSAAGQQQMGLEYHLGHILIAFPEVSTPESLAKTKEEAQTLVKQLKQGAAFSKLAVEKSQASHALEGGDLGWHETNALPTLFANLVPKLQVGQIEGPIEDSSGFHIIKLFDKRQTTTDPKIQRQQAVETLYHKKFEEQLLKWLKELKADSQIEIYGTTTTQAS